MADVPAYSPGDLATIRRAIATGATEVRFADGRLTKFRSLDEMKRIEGLIQAAQPGAIARPTRYAGGVRSNLA